MSDKTIYPRERDLYRERDELIARLAESEAENDQWQKKVAELWAEVERLRAAATEFARGHACDAEDFDAFVKTLGRT